MLVPDRWRAWESGPRQRINAYWLEHVRSDPMLQRAVLTVELRIAGQLILLAREPVRTVRGTTGEVMEYLPGLEAEPEVWQGIELMNQSPAARSVEVSFPAFLLDANEILASGRALTGTAEVALQVPGGDYDLRWVLIRGPITGDLAFGARTETMTLGISDPRMLETRAIPDRVVDPGTWPEAQPEAVGMRIPRIYNGAVGVPAIRVRDDHGGTGLLYAVSDRDHFVASEVWLNGEPKLSGDITHGWAQATVNDAQGRPALCVDFSGSLGPWTERDSVNVTLTPAAGHHRQGVLSVAQELLGEFLVYGRAALNAEMWSHAETRIAATAPRVLINASGQNAPNVVEYVEGGLLQSYPMIHLAYVGAGLGAAVVERRTGPGGRGVVGHLTGGQYPLLDRSSAYTRIGATYTDFEVRYDYDPMSQSYRGIVRRDPTNDRRCMDAERAVGGRVAWPAIESPHIASDTEAAYVIDWLVAHLARQAFRVEWDCAPWAAMRYRPGDTVRYTDPENPAFTEVEATVLGTRFGRGQWGIVLAVWQPDRHRPAVTHPDPPSPAPDAGYGDIETGGIASQSLVETGGV